MSIERSPHVDRDTAERLVTGHCAGPVADVLRAAAAPAHREELTGEDAAVAAFRHAEAMASARPRRGSVVRAVLARVLTVKAVVALAIAGSTGIVLAASDGALPVPWFIGPADRPAEPPAPAPVTRTSTTTTSTTTPTTTAPAKKNQAPGTKDDHRSQPKPGKSTAPKTKDHKQSPPKHPGKPSHSNGPEPSGKPGNGHKKTPDSHALGAATAVPPSGAEPPSQGG